MDKSKKLGANTYNKNMEHRKSNCCNDKIAKYSNSSLFYCATCLCVVAFRKKSYNVIAGVCVLIGLLFVSVEVIAPNHFFRSTANFIKGDVELNDSSLLAYMNEIDIYFPEIVLKQIHWESGHFKSKICKENHNLLGIKYIKQKEAIGINRGHAVYPSYKACLRDYKRLQKYYLGNLGKRYAEDSTYIQKITNSK